LLWGICETKDIILEKYALEFVLAGFTVTPFDFKRFNDNKGE